MFDDLDEAAGYFHDPPIGCINDMCSWKPDVTFKLRTADICPDCLQIMEKRKIEAGVVQHSMEIFEMLRKYMLFNRSFQSEKDFESSIPFAIACTKRKLRATIEPMRKFLLMLDYFDSIVRTAVIVLGKICCKDGFDDFFRNAGLQERPSLGAWVSALQKVAHTRTPLKLEGFPLPDDIEEKLKDVISTANEAQIVHVRNEYRGHGYCSIYNDKYKAIYETVLPALKHIEEVILPLLAGIRICQIVSFSNTQEGKRLRVRLLMGNHPDFEEKEINFSEEMRDIPYENQVYAMKDGCWYDLHPYILYENCPECCHPRLLVCDGNQYLDPFVGHRVRIPT